MPAASIPLDCSVRTLGVLLTRVAFEISSLTLFFVLYLYVQIAVGGELCLE